MTKKTLITLAVALAAVPAAGAQQQTHRATTITGAGSTFVSPLVSVWTPALGSAFDYTVNYSPVGSGAGIAAISNRSVDFGASDAPMTPDQMSACNGCVQIPWALAGTSIPYNIPGLQLPRNTNLHLSGDVIAGIYMGRITNWSDPAIKALNPKATIPDLKITPVHRADNSGTTYNFTDYLSSVSPAWSSQIGKGIAVSWPNGTGASGSSGVAGVVKNTPGAICYVDTAFALTNGLHFAAIKNAAGRFINPSIRNVKAAGEAVTKVPANNEMHIVNPPKKAKKAYVMSTFSYAIIPGFSPKADAIKQFVTYAVSAGQRFGAALDFQTIPAIVAHAATHTLTRIHS
jgi:phosphate transport system substrate-binding protein